MEPNSHDFIQKQKKTNTIPSSGQSVCNSSPPYSRIAVRPSVLLSSASQRAASFSRSWSGHCVFQPPAFLFLFIVFSIILTLSVNYICKPPQTTAQTQTTARGQKCAPVQITAMPEIPRNCRSKNRTPPQLKAFFK